jgi:hypothetical protein
MFRVPAFLIFGLGLTSLSFVGVAQQPAQQTVSTKVASAKYEALIDALTTYPFGEVYTEDIANENSITYSGKKPDGSGVIPVPPVKAIAELGGQPTILLLIGHLNDQRPTQAKYHEQAVPVAYLALDLLLHMSDMNDERAVVPGCEQHGLGDCMQPDFYFSPDASDPNILSSVQKDWAEENKRQPINFVYPSWWRSDAPTAPGAPRSRQRQ